MRQHMPGDYGWVDCGPSLRPEAPPTGPVRARYPFGATRDSVLVQPAYTPTELRTVIKRGEEDPRALTRAEQAIANRNRVAADADLAAFEKWARDGFCVPEGNR